MYGFTPFATQDPNLSGLGSTMPLSNADIKDLIDAGYTVDPELLKQYAGGSGAGFDISKPPMWLLLAGGALLGLALLRKR